MICKNCNSIISDTSVFCNKCGSKIEHKLICSSCKKELETDSLFCNFCGTKTSEGKELPIFRHAEPAPSFKPAESAPIMQAPTVGLASTDTSANKVCAHEQKTGLIKNLIVLVVSIIMFGLSFSSIVSVSTLFNNVTISNTTIQLYEAAFNNNYSSTDMWADTEDYLSEISTDTLEKLVYGDTLTTLEKKEVTEALSNINSFAVLNLEDIKTDSAYTNTTFWTFFAIILLWQIVLLTAIIWSLVGIVNSKAIPFATISSTIFGISALAMIIAAGIGNGAGSALIVAFVLSCIMLIALAATNLATTKSDKKQIKKSAFRLIAVAFTMAIMATTLASSSTLVYERSGQDATVSVNSMAYVYYLDVATGGDNLTTYDVEYLNETLSSLTKNEAELYMKTFDSGILANEALLKYFEPTFYAAGMSSYIMQAVAVMMCICLILLSWQFVANKSRKTNLDVKLMMLVSAVFAITAAILIGITCSCFNTTMEYFEYSFRMKLGATIIVNAIFSIITLIYLQSTKKQAFSVTEQVQMPQRTTTAPNNTNTGYYI